MPLAWKNGALGTERVPHLWNQAPVVWSGASGSGSGPLTTRLYGFATREKQGATPELHHLWGSHCNMQVACGGVWLQLSWLLSGEMSP